MFQRPVRSRLWGGIILGGGVAVVVGSWQWRSAHAAREALDRPLTLAIVDRPLPEVLARLSQESGRPIVAEIPSPPPKVSLAVEEGTVRQALDQLAERWGCRWMEVDGLTTFESRSRPIPAYAQGTPTARTQEGSEAALAFLKSLSPAQQEVLRTGGVLEFGSLSPPQRDLVPKALALHEGFITEEERQGWFQQGEPEDKLIGIGLLFDPYVAFREPPIFSATKDLPRHRIFLLIEPTLLRYQRLLRDKTTGTLRSYPEKAPE